jgi:hypothetical protein
VPAAPTRRPPDLDLDPIEWLVLDSNEDLAPGCSRIEAVEDECAELSGGFGI